MYAIAARIRAQDEATAYWDDLYTQSRVVLYRTAALLLPPEEAEEVVQEAFERAFRSDRFRGETQVPLAWLRTAVGRLAVDRLRRRRLWERIRAMRLVPGVSESASSRLEVRDALRRLPPRQRVALVLRYYQDAPYDEIADALSMKTESVGPLLSRAKQALREALRD